MLNPHLSHKKVVILADGSFPTHPEPLRLLREASFIACCDGAAAALTDFGIEPGVVIGDLDSLSRELEERYRDRLVPDPDQETNDLTKAVKWCVRHGATELVILGATGKREDHTLGNISLLASYGKLKTSYASTGNISDSQKTSHNNINQSVDATEPAPDSPSAAPAFNSAAAAPAGSSITVKMITDTGTLFPVYGTCTIKSFPAQSVSIFSLDSNAEVTSSGLKYPLNKVILNSWWTATLNIATGTTFTLSLAPAPLIIYLGHLQP
jgi:thiamine pyrophosphokinase